MREINNLKELPNEVIKIIKEEYENFQKNEISKLIPISYNNKHWFLLMVRDNGIKAKVVEVKDFNENIDELIKLM